MNSEDFKTFPWLKDIDKNLIHDWSDLVINSNSYNHEEITLRDELSIVHQTYRKEINLLKKSIHLKDERISKLIDKMITLDLNYEQLNEEFEEMKKDDDFSDDALEGMELMIEDQKEKIKNLETYIKEFKV